jgi:sugar-specific transcriptional regulator TrmB
MKDQSNEARYASNLRRILQSPLTPFEEWCVRSNLKTIKSGVPAAVIIATVRANGYSKIADAIAAAVRKGLLAVVNVRIDDKRIAQFDAARAAVSKAKGGR